MSAGAVEGRSISCTGNFGTIGFLHDLRPSWIVFIWKKNCFVVSLFGQKRKRQTVHDFGAKNAHHKHVEYVT